MNDLVGKTFCANIKGGVVVMKVEKVVMGLCYCKSLCLRYTVELFSDVIRRQLAKEAP